MNDIVDLRKLIPSWRTFEKISHIGPIKNKSHYQQMIVLMNRLLDETRNNKNHHLDGLLHIVSNIIEEYEETHYTIPEVPPHEVLRYLMDEHELTQSDLPEIGNQAKVSEILSGKRKLNVRQIALLAKRFKVSESVFFEDRV